VMFCQGITYNYSALIIRSLAIGILSEVVIPVFFFRSGASKRENCLGSA
jgi:hypothetical protein